MLTFSVLKTGIEISPLFFAVLTLFLLTDRMGIAFPAILISIAHEAGHFLALICLKTAPKKVKISLTGIQMELYSNMSTEGKISVLSAGFAVNFCLAALLFAFGENLSATVSLLIGIFTMLPLASTDGGSIIKELIEARFTERAKTIENKFFISTCAAFSFLLVVAATATKNPYLLIAIFYLVACTVKAER